MRVQLRRTAITTGVVAAAMSGGLALAGGAQATSAAPEAGAATVAAPNGCAKIKPLANNGVQVINVSCGKPIRVQVIWSAIPNSKFYLIGIGGKRDYYPHFAWQTYQTHVIR